MLINWHLTYITVYFLPPCVRVVRVYIQTIRTKLAEDELSKVKIVIFAVSDWHHEGRLRFIDMQSRKRSGVGVHEEGGSVPKKRAGAVPPSYRDCFKSALFRNETLKSYQTQYDKSSP